MFSKHVTKDLSACLHGELSEERRSDVTAHLLRCAACRAAYEEIRLGAEFAQAMTVTEAPDSLWEGIEAKLAEPATPESRKAAIVYRGIRGDDPSAPRFPGAVWWKELPTPVRWALPLAAALLLVFGADRLFRTPQRAWDVTPIAGDTRIGSNLLRAAGRLGVGEWLRTDSGASARLSVADIGRLTIEPDSRLRLLETGPGGHRLELEEGTIEAIVTAPPRLFFVETPSAVAVDLGCAYRLSVDASGGSLLEVTSGWVALEEGGRESLVPAGAACLTMTGFGPGTPVFADASPWLKVALQSFDFENGGAAALRTVLDQARPRDTLSLWHLLSRVGVAERGEVFETMAALSPPPKDVTREKIEHLDPKTLEAWRKDLRRVW